MQPCEKMRPLAMPRSLQWGLFLGLALLLSGLVFGACVQRPRMCSVPNECGPGAACVSGRCLPDGGVPAIQNARRLLVEPVDVAYLHHGDALPGGELPEIATLGRASQSEAIVLLRFALVLPSDATILEAYLLLERTHAVDVDPAPITLHTARIVDPWDGRSVSWPLQPRLEDARSPSTTVIPTGQTIVRLDVREIVQHWRAHATRDQGIAVVADDLSATGIAFALTASSEAPPLSVEPLSPEAPRALPNDTTARLGAQRIGPRLELYVK